MVRNRIKCILFILSHENVVYPLFWTGGDGFRYIRIPTETENHIKQHELK